MAYLAMSCAVDKENLKASTATPPTNELPIAGTKAQVKSTRTVQARNHRDNNRIMPHPTYIYIPVKNTWWENIANWAVRKL